MTQPPELWTHREKHHDRDTHRDRPAAGAGHGHRDLDRRRRLLLRGTRPADDALDEAQRRSAAAGLPSISVSAAQGKLLHLLARSIGARRILQVGTLGGYSTIWLATAIRSPGALITLELDRRHAEVARGNLDRAGVGDLVDIRVGPAADSLAALAGAGPEPFDFVFIDADKSSNAVYFDYAVRLGHPGTVIVVDNVARGGRVADSANRDADVQGVRRLADPAGGCVAASPRPAAAGYSTARGGLAQGSTAVSGVAHGSTAVSGLARRECTESGHKARRAAAAHAVTS